MKLQSLEVNLPIGKRRSFFYGYVVVAAGFAIGAMLVGSFLSLGVFFKPVSLEFGWARATTSVAASTAQLMAGAFGLLFGRLTDKYGPMLVLIGCGLSMGLGHIMLSQVNALWQFYLFFGLIVGIGLGGAETPIVVTIARWFTQRRGLMTGITKVGAGVGIMLIPVLANSLILGHGWQVAYIVVGIIALVVVIPSALFMKRDPSQIGETPYGADDTAATELVVNIRSYSLHEAIAARQFWLFSIVWFSFMFCIGIVQLHLIPHVTDVGVSTTIAATMMSVVGGSSILGRVAFASLSDKLGTKFMYIVAFTFLGISMAWMKLADEVWMFYLFAVLYGTAHGACFAMFAPMIANLFGLGSLGILVSTVFFLGTWAAVISPTLAGYVFDSTGSYQIAFSIGLAFCILGILLLLLLKSQAIKSHR